MRAKTVNEQQDFERGKDPKEAMGVGMTGFKDYMDRKLQDMGDDPKEFWNYYANIIRNFSDTQTLWEEMMEILGHTPLEFQKMWADDKLEFWREVKEEMQ